MRGTLLALLIPLLALGAHARAEDPVIGMLAQVSQANLRASLARLSGVEPVDIDGQWVRFTTRHTESDQAPHVTTYLRGVLAAQGVRVGFHSWDGGRNVVAELPGGDLRDEVVLLVAHADSISDDEEEDEEAPAPGVDDDASGCAALLEMARIMRAERFRRTVRFVFTMGEEQGYLGARAYARKVAREEPSVEAVLNLDMIAYSTATSLPAPCRVKIRNREEDPEGYRADLPLARAFLEAVETCGLGDRLEPELTDDGEEMGDQVAFWEEGIPAAWVIEDDQENWNENYHSGEDSLENANLPYLSAMVQATLATAARLADGDD